MNTAPELIREAQSGLSGMDDQWIGKPMDCLAGLIVPLGNSQRVISHDQHQPVQSGTLIFNVRRGEQ